MFFRKSRRIYIRALGFRVHERPDACLFCNFARLSEVLLKIRKDGFAEGREIVIDKETVI